MTQEKPPSLLEMLTPLAQTNEEGQLLLHVELAIGLLTRAGGGHPLDREAAEEYVARFAKDGMLLLEDFCTAHDAERPKPLPGFLLAAFPASEYFDDGEGITEQDGDGPPSTDDEEDQDTVGSMKQGWSSSGGSREGSFRKRGDDKTTRAQQIRSDCLTSHLVTPAFQGRRLVLPDATPPPPGSMTVGFKPRTLAAGGSSAPITREKVENTGSFKVSHNKKKTLDSLSALAVGKK